MATTVRSIGLITASGALLAVTATVMLTIGTAHVPVQTVFAVLFHHLFGMGGGDIPSIQETIVWNIRWQRVALAMLVGSGLAVSGACFQTMFKNPLADPFILGVSSGAALGAALSIIAHQPGWMIPLAFLGALTSLGMVYLFGQSGRQIASDQQLLLAGIACGALFNAVLSALIALYSHQMEVILFWLLGSLSNYANSLIPLAVIVAAGLTVAMLYARELDVMVLGDDDARFLGVDVEKVKMILLVSTTLMTGACVSVSGIIGFIGLIVPHLVRNIAGPGHRVLLPLSAIFGALFLLFADGMTRVADPLAGIPVGVVTALFGSPFFLYVLYTASRRGQ